MIMIMTKCGRRVRRVIFSVLVLGLLAGCEDAVNQPIINGEDETGGEPNEPHAACVPGPCLLVSVVDFSTHVKDDNPFYQLDDDGVLEIKRYIDNLEFSGATSAYEAVYKGAQRAVDINLGPDDSRYSRTVVFFTDGLENSSLRGDEDLKNLHRIQIEFSDNMYTIASGVKGKDAIDLTDDEFMSELCRYIEPSGESCRESSTISRITNYGKAGLFRNFNDLSDEFRKIANDLVTKSKASTTRVGIPINADRYLLWTLDLDESHNTPASSNLYILTEYDSAKRDRVRATLLYNPNIQSSDLEFYVDRVKVDEEKREVVFEYTLHNVSPDIVFQKPRLWTRELPPPEDSSPRLSTWVRDSEPEGRTNTGLISEHNNAAMVLVIDRSGSLKGSEADVRSAIGSLLDTMIEARKL